MELVPKLNRKAAAISDVTWVSTIVIHARSNPAVTAARALRACASSSLMRSKISTLESTPMPMVRMSPAIPGSVIVTGMNATSADQDEQVQRDRRDRVQPGQPVVAEHEEHDERQTANGGEHAGTNRCRAQARADGAFLDILQVRRQRPGLEVDHLLDHLLVAEARDLPVIVDARQDCGDGGDAVIEHGRQARG